MTTVTRVLGGLPIALEFLTPLRFRPVRQHENRAFAESLGWYPAIGLLIGLVLLGADELLSEVLPAAPTAAILVALLALLSGGLHLDGVSDTADGMAVQGDRERRLAVMRDGTSGPAGVMALVLVLLLGWSALASLDGPLRGGALVLGPAVARWAVLPVAAVVAPARPDGLGWAIHEGVWPVAAPLATLIAAVAAVLLFGVGGLVVMLLAGGAALAMAGLAARLIGGVTGDVFGASIELAQLVTWLSIVAAQQRAWIDPGLLG
jgi:adenosylcobinamide-GDP ribazoletransferase